MGSLTFYVCVYITCHNSRNFEFRCYKKNLYLKQNDKFFYTKFLLASNTIYGEYMMLIDMNKNIVSYMKISNTKFCEQINANYSNSSHCYNNIVLSSHAWTK